MGGPTPSPRDRPRLWDRAAERARCPHSSGELRPGPAQAPAVRAGKIGYPLRSALTSKQYILSYTVISVGHRHAKSCELSLCYAWVPSLATCPLPIGVCLSWFVTMRHLATGGLAGELPRKASSPGAADGQTTALAAKPTGWPSICMRGRALGGRAFAVRHLARHRRSCTS